MLIRPYGSWSGISLDITEGKGKMAEADRRYGFEEIDFDCDFDCDSDFDPKR
jgi:hypothetical protein